MPSTRQFQRYVQYTVRLNGLLLEPLGEVCVTRGSEKGSAKKGRSPAVLCVQLGVGFSIQGFRAFAMQVLRACRGIERPKPAGGLNRGLAICASSSDHETCSLSASDAQYGNMPHGVRL